MACEAKTSEIFKDVALFICSCLFCFLFFFVFFCFALFQKKSCFPISRFLFFCLSFFVDCFLLFVSFFHFSVVREDAEKRKEKRRKVPVVKVTIFLCEDVIFGPRWKVTGVGLAHFKRTTLAFFHVFSFFSFFFLSLLCLSYFFLFQTYFIACIRSSMEMWCPDSWGFLGHQLGREHGAPPRGGVDAPRLVKRSLSRLYYCSCSCSCSCSCICCCSCNCSCSSSGSGSGIVSDSDGVY